MQKISRNTDIILFSNNNLVLGERLREYFRKINVDVIYCNTLKLLVSKIKNRRNNIIFIDKIFKIYAKFLKEIINSDIELLDRTRFVFIDDDFKYYLNYVDNEMLFSIPESNLESAIYNTIVNCELLNYRKDSFLSVIGHVGKYVSDYLLSMGFSYKLIGFRYIKQCVEQAVRNNFKLGSLHKDVYPYVAMQNVTNSFNIERGIRTAINDAAKTPEFHKILTLPKGKHITNRLFLEFLLDKIVTEKAK